MNVNYSKRKSNYRYTELIIISAFLLIYSILSITIITNVESHTKEDIGKSLKTVRNTTLETFRLWKNQKITDISHVSKDPVFIDLVKEFIKLPRDREFLIGHPLQKEIRQVVRPIVEESGYIGIFLFTRDSVSLTSLRDANIGTNNFMFEKRGEILNEVFNGSIKIIPPIHSDVPIPGRDGELVYRFPTMFVAAPVIDSTGYVLAIFTLRIDLNSEFTDLANVGRLGETGETYAIDKNGFLISESRFSHLLISKGVITEEEKAIAAIRICDPGVDITDPNVKYNYSTELPLTKMAASAIRGESDLDTEGYNDYRGVNVFGAWIWDDDLEIGLATEIDVTEALNSFYNLREKFIFLTIIILIVILFMFITLSRVRSKSLRQLEKAHNELELKVKERTAELNEEKYLSDLLLRTIPDSVYFKDKESKFIKLNQAGVEKLGYESEEQVLGKSDSDFFGAEHAVEAERDEKYILETQKSIINKLEKEVWPNGKESWVITSKFPLYNNEGVLEGTFGISRDVTKLIQTEEKLKLTQFAVDHGGDEVFLITPGAKFKWVNEKACENLGYTYDELLDLSVKDVDPDFPVEIWPDHWKELKAKKHLVFETRHKSKDGRVIPVEVMANFVEVGGEEYNFAFARDITERKTAEKELIEKEARLKEAQQIAHIGHWELEIETSLLKWSDEAFRIFGYAPQEFTPTLDIFIQRLHPDDRELVLSSFEISVSKKQNYSIAHRIIRPDNEIRYVSEVGKTFYDGEIPVRSIGTVQDITELKKAERALMESESRFRTLITNMPSVVYRCKLDKDWTMLYISDPIKMLSGYPASEFILNNARTYESIIHPDDSDGVDKAVNDAIEKKEAWQINYRIQSKDNGIKWVHERGQAHFEDEIPIWLDGVIYDVTDQKIAEQALEESTRRLELALEAANAGSYFWDLETDAMLMDEKSYELYGIERREYLKNKELLEYVHKDDSQKTGPIVNNAIENSETFHIEFRIFQPGGELKYAAAHGFVIKDDLGRPMAVAGLHFDITKRKEDEALLEEAKAGAEEASQAKSEFLARMSHELRTPLNGILGYAQILKREENLSKIQKKGLSIIESSGQHLLDLINDILDLSKIEARQFDLHLQNFELDQLITTIGQLIKIKAETKGISFYWKSEGIENKIAVGDPRALRQILLNLLGNAVKFTDQGNVALNVYYDDKIIKLEILDTGIGISEDKLEVIFEPFKQTGIKAKTAEGTGLGLAITRKLVEMMNGKIAVESEPGKGSKFLVELYLPASTETLTSTKQTDMEICGYEGDVKTIIIADDIKTNLSLLESILEPLNFNLLTAMNGKEVIDLVEKNNIDLVLMDIVMPEMDGSEATQILKSNPATKHIPVIAVTASISKKQLDTIEEKQYDDYLSKPFPLDLLFTKIQQQLDLTWKFKSKEIVLPAATGTADDGTIVLPAEEIINKIMEFAELGAFGKITEVTEKLIKESEKYTGFVEKVNTYVANYDEDGLLDYLKNI